MQTIVRNIGDFDDLNFEVDLTEYGKTGADVADIIFVVKKNVDDTSYLLEKKNSDTEITFSGTTVLDVLVQWAETEYTGFNEDETYIAGLYLQFTGDPVADLHTKQDFNLTVQKRVL